MFLTACGDDFILKCEEISPRCSLINRNLPWKQKWIILINFFFKFNWIFYCKKPHFTIYFPKQRLYIACFQCWLNDFLILILIRYNRDGFITMKWKTTIYHTVGTILQSNRKILEKGKLYTSLSVICAGYQHHTVPQPTCEAFYNQMISLPLLLVRSCILCRHQYPHLMVTQPMWETCEETNKNERETNGLWNVSDCGWVIIWYGYGWRHNTHDVTSKNVNDSLCLLNA
jgi:ribosomal protein L37AE/L43A